MPGSNNLKQIYLAVAQPEEDAWISVTMIIFADVLLYHNLNIEDYVFSTGKAARIDSKLQVHVDLSLLFYI